MSVPKKRIHGKSSPPTGDVDDPLLKYTKGASKCEQISEHWLLQPLPESQSRYNFLVTVVTLIAFAARFYKIWYPKEVVFDEVHFGKFASYYLERSYFFDVHPPFAKMMIGFIGWLCGYNGSFKFDEIGYSYETHPAPYVAYRSFNAILGTLTVPIMFNTLKELNFKAMTCAFASLLVAIDTAHVTETRLILLDAILIISIAATMYCYVRFYKCQLRQPFTWSWYIWLHATGLSLSFVISTKYVGVMTYAAIGFAVVVNLWQLLDVKAGLSLRLFMKHFSKRLNGLVLIPFLIYLFWFWVHFTVLNTSGPGDAFMSAEFQETLYDSPLNIDSKVVNYFDIITLKHQDTDVFLHSHLAHYPQRYEDGRISSAGQQVTGYAHPDFNNQWEVLPPRDSDIGKGQAVLLNQHVRLRHVATDTYLLAHDVASPFYPTNEEVTAVSIEEGDGDSYPETLFTFQPLKKSDEGHILKSKTVYFRLFHVDTSVALWTHNDELLPDWGFQQQEVNGNKKVTDPSNNWAVDEIVNLDEDRKVYVPKVVKPLPFLKKWIETQKSMFEHNNKLSSEHPFASEPYSWPGSLSGVSFWTNGDEKKQIYFIGNIIGWWFQVVSLAVFVGIIMADLLTRHRGYYALNKITREKLYGPLMFFFISWCCHYFPFFLMARQKFLHHYLPAHLIACLFSGALWEVIFSNCKSLNLENDEGVPGTPYEKNPKIYVKPYAVFLVCASAAVIWCFIYFAPLVYGDVSLSPSEVVSREWFDIELNYSK